MALKNISEKEFRQLVTGERPVLVEFWAPWCVYCRRIAPALDKVADQNVEGVQVVQVNIDDEPELARSERIELVPTMILYRGGKVLASIVAPESKAKIEEFIRESLNQ
ncbi:MAG: thioredoxin family protein [Oscillospiraceae bacterium]|nr:thioredoxin family protein [Oscillospiraceae bacterium]